VFFLSRYFLALSCSVKPLDTVSVRVGKARSRVMHAKHQKRCTRDEAIEPPTINIIIGLSGVVQN
jgi:hypothetical protein